jgi:flagellar biosynthesis/type III secretory pathway M-ring protein FliF/YscJ
MTNNESKWAWKNMKLNKGFWIVAVALVVLIVIAIVRAAY